MRDRFLFLLLGGALLMAGYFIGQASTPSAALAQSIVTTDQARFLRVGDAIISSSDDGKTLHFWATNDRAREIDRKPVYVGSVSASESGSPDPKHPS